MFLLWVLFWVCIFGLLSSSFHSSSSSIHTSPPLYHPPRLKIPSYASVLPTYVWGHVSKPARLVCFWQLYGEFCRWAFYLLP